MSFAHSKRGGFGGRSPLINMSFAHSKRGGFGGRSSLIK
jgi:hypothetical protein